MGGQFGGRVVDVVGRAGGTVEDGLLRRVVVVLPCTVVVVVGAAVVVVVGAAVVVVVVGHVLG